MSGKHDDYLLPRANNDETTEYKRLDGQHELFRILLGSISHAPLPDTVSSVLDLGCGTGIWSCEFAESHPSTKVLGVDIAPPDDTLRLTPENCTFIKANIEEDWTFGSSESFDFIFARLLVAGVKDWPQLFRRVYSSLRPGGIYELYEGRLVLCADDETTSKDSALMRWYDMIREFSASRGIDPDVADTLTGHLEDCKFNILQDDKVIRVYADPDVALSHGLPNSARAAKYFVESLTAMVVNMTEKGFNSPAQRALAQEAIQDLMENSKSRGYHSVHTHKIAQKPV